MTQLHQPLTMDKHLKRIPQRSANTRYLVRLLRTGQVEKPKAT